MNDGFLVMADAARLRYVGPAPTVVTLASDSTKLTEGDSLTLTATRSNADAPLTINLATSGSAGASDVTVPTSISFAAGQFIATAPVTALNDGVAEAIESVTIDLTAAAGYMLGAPTSVSVAIKSVEVIPPVADAGPDQVLHDSNGDGLETVTFNGSASTDPDGDLTVEWFDGAQRLALGVNGTAKMAPVCTP